MLVSCNQPRVPCPTFVFSLLCVEIVNEVRIFPSDFILRCWQMELFPINMKRVAKHSHKLLNPSGDSQMLFLTC